MQGMERGSSCGTSRAFLRQPGEGSSRDAQRLYAEASRFVELGRDAEASKKLDAALRQAPDFAEALSLGAYILERSGKLDVALRFYARATAINPSLLPAWSNLGKLLFKLGRFVDALAALDTALALHPEDADVLNSRSGVLRALWKLSDSEAAARAALRRRPNFPEAALNLGAALIKLGRPEEALAAFRRSAAARAGYGDALCGEALALRALDRLEEARRAFAAAERLGCREAVSGRGCLDLTLGDFASGWEGYEARWIDGKSIADALGMQYPLWQGPNEKPQRVLVINDHGLGDTIQFCRYLPLMRRAGAEPYFLGPAKLHRLVGLTVEGRIFERMPEGASFDAQIAISSLPRAFKTRLGDVPAELPYLVAEPERIARWKARIGKTGFRIGIAWQGNAHPDADPGRAFPLGDLAPLAGRPGVRLISLQKGYGQEQILNSHPFRVEELDADYDSGPHAFLDAAAVMHAVDLIVTCDTSIAHLAGALARPVWVALKKDAEWRWLRERSDSPWYPTMRLFRQKRLGDWSSVFGDMATALSSSAA